MAIRNSICGLLLALCILITPVIAVAQPVIADTQLATAGTPSAEPISVPPIDLSKDVSGAIAPPAMSMTETEQKVLDYLEKDESAQAQKLLNSTIAKSKGNKDSELLSLRAYLHFQSNDYKKAAQDLQKSLSQKHGGASDASGYRAFHITALRIKCLGDTYYSMHRKKEALKQYQDALLLTQRSPELDALRVCILEPLTSCLIDDGDFENAQIQGEQLVACCQRLASDGQLVNIGPLFWSQIELLRIYKEQGEKEKSQPLHASVASLLKTLNSLRNELTSPLTLSERAAFPARLRTALLSQYIAQIQPKRLSEYLWLTANYRLRSLPLISWQPGESKAGGTPTLPGEHKPVAAILCVHGLGLENRAFASFAAEMTKRDFAVYAMDARGFGAWQSEFGSQTVNFDQTLSDIHTIINLIKEESPDVPVFLLGESMGGALALRAAVDYSADMTGIIASVPSAERFGDARMSLRVATHFLRHPNRPFDIGSEIATQETAHQEIRNLIEADPKARQNLSAVELIKFNKFMIATQKKCSLIKTTPVLVVQGLADRLVKPKGTYEMFDNVRSPDKAMLIIGNAEHLIFETPQQSPVLLDGLTAWLNNHIPGKN